MSNRARAPCLRRLLLAAVLPPPERAPPPLHSHHTYKHKHKHKLITHRVMVLKRGSSVGVSTTRSAATARSRAASTPNTRVSHSMMGTLEAAAPPSEVGEGEVGAPSLSASVLGAAACGRGVGGRGKGAVGGGGGSACAFGVDSPTPSCAPRGPSPCCSCSPCCSSGVSGGGCRGFGAPSTL